MKGPRDSHLKGGSSLINIQKSGQVVLHWYLIPTGRAFQLPMSGQLSTGMGKYVYEMLIP